MKVVFLTGDECPPCHDLEGKFREKFKQELDSGEAVVLNLSQDPEAQDWWLANELPAAPALVVATEEGKVVGLLDIEDL